ncbi:MAG: Uma2 family endonuclease [Caldilineae bacterium]|nr:MAG: Uma2 family endonuclease [Caldilineae bacterium]
MMVTEAIAPQTRPITGEELAMMDDVGPCELVEGRIAPMVPTGDEHGGVEITLGALLHNFAKTHNLGKVRVGEVGIYIRRNPDTVRAADILFISNERYAQKGESAYLDVAPDLVVEIMSPGDVWSNVMQKLREYLGIGVRVVWIVDPPSRSVYAYRALTDVREFTAGDALSGDDVLPGFSVKVSEIFE